MRRRLYPCIHPDTDVYYVMQKLLSHNADISIAQSIRDLGKSHDAYAVLKKSAENGRNSVISRWEITELEHVEHDVFELSEIHSKDNPDGLWQKNGVSKSTWFYERIDNHAQIWFMSTKASNKNKGTDIKKLDWWFYDEFIPEIYDSQTRRVQEFDRFVSMYWTLIRNNTRFRVIMCCNAITWFNGYYDAWNIKPFMPGHIMKQMIDIDIDGVKRTLTIAIENVRPTRAMIERIAKNEAVKGRRFDAAYFDNLTNDNTAFIKSCPDPKVPFFNGQWVFLKRIYTYRYHDGLYWWSETSKRDVPTYTTSKSDVGVDVIRDRQMGRTFDILYDRGVMRFDTGNVEQAVLSMIWAGRQNQI